MKYLFFDLEFATSKGGVSKICEFGYVLTDENFVILKRENWIINPNINRLDWDYRVVRKILTRSISTYEKNQTFDEYYEKIKQLIKSSDYVIGHTLDSDAKALNDDCERYRLGSIDFDFYDVKLFYKEYSNSKKDIGLKDILKQLNIQGEENEHDAETDAYNTMLELKTILAKLNLTFKELIELCPNAKDRTENFIIESVERNLKKQEAAFKEHIHGDGTNKIVRGKLNWKRYLQFLDNVKPQEEKLGNKFENKKISMAMNYEENHYKQILNLIQLAVNEGASVTRKVSESDIFIQYDVLLEDGTIKEDLRYQSIMNDASLVKKIQVISFNEFLSKLEITEEMLNAMPSVSFDFLYEENAIIKDKKDKLIIDRIMGRKTPKKLTSSGDTIVEGSSEELTSSIGDFFKEQLMAYLKK